MLEQIRLCDTFVDYDDVQYSRGSFSNRVQIKTSSGIRWLTVPLKNHHLGQLINEVEIDNRVNWQRSQRDFLRQAYAKAPYRNEMLRLVDAVFSCKYESLGELARLSTMALITYFGLNIARTFHNSTSLATPGASTQRVIDLCRRLKAKSYLTGHGAQHYLDHESFETHGIDVVYMNYGLLSYPQAHGAFTSYVTALDLVANCGKDGASFITGAPIPWREFIAIDKDASIRDRVCKT